MQIIWHHINFKDAGMYPDALTGFRHLKLTNFWRAAQSHPGAHGQL